MTWDDYEDRYESDQASQRTMPIAHMIALCNRLGASPWFCMPHKADDDFVRRWATLARDSLHPDAKVYVEHSNEIWNPAFGQWRHYESLKEAEGTKHSHEQKAREIARDFEIWREVFAEAGRSDRLVRVVAGQAVNPWHIERLTELLGSPGEDFDAIAIAGYFGPKARDIPPNASVDELVALCEADLRERSLPGWQKHGELARRLGVPLLAYEGGQHVTPVGRDVRWMRAFEQLQRDPRMGALYAEMLELWREAAGEGSVFVAFSDVRRIDRHGAWGHLEYQDQPVDRAPKYKALLEHAGEIGPRP